LENLADCRPGVASAACDAQRLTIGKRRCSRHDDATRHHLFLGDPLFVVAPREKPIRAAVTDRSDASDAADPRLVGRQEVELIRPLARSGILRG
jgi:hypothetical protein